jgi:hypothetical protein
MENRTRTNHFRRSNRAVICIIFPFTRVQVCAYKATRSWKTTLGNAYPPARVLYSLSPPKHFLNRPIPQTHKNPQNHPKKALFKKNFSLAGKIDHLDSITLMGFSTQCNLIHQHLISPPRI